MEYSCVVDMDSPSTRSAELAGCDDGLEQARTSGVTETSASTDGTTDNRNGIMGEQSAAALPSGAAASSIDDRAARSKTTTYPNNYLYALNLHQHCRILPPVTLLVKHVEDVQAAFRNISIDMQTPCTMTDMEPCWVLYNLSTFNHILKQASIEVTEIEPRRLLIHSLRDHMFSSSESAIVKACILLDLLLKTHRCVHQLFLCSHIVDRSWCAEMLSVSLASNTSIKHVTTEGQCVLLYTPGHPLIDSICKMSSSLESLRITGLHLGAVTVERLGVMIAKMKSLRSVEFTKNCLPRGAGEELMKGMCKNSNLEAVSLAHAAIGRSGARALGDYLATPSKLRELSLSSLEEFDQEQMAFITEGLKTNIGLEILEIEELYAASGTMVSFAEVLKSHTSLKYLAVTCCHLVEADANSFAVLLECNTKLLKLDLSGNAINDAGAIRLAQSLKYNGSLQKLNLSKNSISYRGAVPLAEAMASNGALKELALLGVSDEKKERPIAAALSRNGVHGRMIVRHESITSVLQLATGVSQNATLVTTLHLDASIIVNAHCLKTLFESLANVPLLKRLLLGCQTSFNRTAADKLAELLLKTKALEWVQIKHCDMDLVALQTVMNGLADNRSVWHMDVEFGVRSFACTRAIVDMLKRNSTLIYFGTFLLRPLELRFLASELWSNYVLTTLHAIAFVSMYGNPDAEQPVFEIREVLRRNRSYVNRAVEYAMDPEKFGTQRERAAIFDELCHKESFKQVFSKLVGPHGAIRAVSKARAHITENLLAITGVAMHFPVTCWPHPAGSSQIDILNTYCWRSILSYVKVTDIAM